MKRVKILFIIPGKGRHQYISFGIGYLSSYLKKYLKGKVNIKLADENAGDNIYKIIDQFKPEFAAITATTAQIAQAGQVASQIKTQAPQTIVILGGIHVSVLPKETLTIIPQVNIGVIGEGEVTLKELLEKYSKYNVLSPQILKNIKGIIYRNAQGLLIVTDKRLQINNVDTIPSPDRTIFNPHYYYAPRQLIRGLPALRSTSILTSRGCPYHCIFCSSNIMAGHYRTHSVPYIMNEVHSLVKHQNIQALYFHDDLFIANKQRVSDLCESLIKHNYHKKIIWSCQVRAELITDSTIPLLNKMKEAGCKQLEFGFESGSERLLKFLKGATASVAGNQKAIDITNLVGLRVFGNFMIGSLTETKSDLNKTVSFIENNLNKINFFQAYITMPLPGTILWQLCAKKKMLADNYTNYYLFNGDNLSQVFNDTIPHDYLISTLKYLNRLALNKMPLSEKIAWFSQFIIKDPRYVAKRMYNYLVH